MSSVLQDGTAGRPRQDVARTGEVLDGPRLTDALDADVPLVLVVAPAGSGTTVAVSAWAAQVTRPLAWVDLARDDLTGPGPWVAIVAALRRTGVRVPSLVSLGDPDAGGHALPTMLGAHLAAHREPVVVVLDCDGPMPADLAVGLDLVLRQAQGRLRLVILCRTDPPLPILRHRREGSVVEIQGADLAFQRDEDSALLVVDLTAEPVAAGPDVVAVEHDRRGDALLVLGRLGQAAQAYREGSGRFGRLALVGALSGDLRIARVLAERALAGSPPVDPCAHVAIAWIEVESDDLDAARAHVRAAGRVPVTTADPVPGTVLSLLDARLRRAAGDLDGARHALATAFRAPSWLADLVLLEHAALDLAAGRPSNALERHASLADRSSTGAEHLLWQVRLAEWAQGSGNPPTEPGATLTARVEGWLLEASRCLSLGEAVAARRAVQRALRLAEPEQLRRPFLEATADVRRLLLEEPLARTAAPAGHGPAQDLVDPLTEREREVLGHLAAMMSTGEIATAMFVSVNTVRTHVRNVLRKLGVSRRNEAVRRARTLQLIP